MGLTPSAETSADLLGMLTPACTMTLRSSKRALWIFLLCAAFCAFNATAMDGNNAAPGHAWTPGRHIIAMPESGHPAIMDGAATSATSAPQRIWTQRPLRMRLPTGSFASISIYRTLLGSQASAPQALPSPSCTVRTVRTVRTPRGNRVLRGRIFMAGLCK